MLMMAGTTTVEISGTHGEPVGLLVTDMGLGVLKTEGYRENGQNARVSFNKKCKCWHCGVEGRGRGWETSSEAF